MKSDKYQELVLKHLEGLASGQQTLEKRVDDIANGQKALEKRIEDVVEGQQAMEKRIDARMDSFDKRMDSFENRMDSFDKRMDSFDKRMDSFEEGQKALNKKVDALAVRVENELVDKIRVLFDAHSMYLDYFASIKESQARIEKDTGFIKSVWVEMDGRLNRQEREIRLLWAERGKGPVDRVKE
ncbi:MAG: hypothetical protein QHH10_02925 [Peptococcaceae bacterium]|nr:hypothetical protein [Peptococcaceae bacterium]MDH7524248.1 hypothetical protein [Peptococcaceae bacterium]